MATRLKWMLVLLVIAAGGVAYKQRVFLLDLVQTPASDGLAGEDLVDLGGGPVGSQSRPSGPQREPDPTADPLSKNFDLANLTVPREEIATLLIPDAIPALTDPALEPAGTSEWLADDSRVIEVVVGDEAIGVPFRILDWHEIVNTTVGGEPLAITYCPLCDSAAVFSRRVVDAGANAQSRETVLEFGVSGSLYNSNVLMYDRRDRGLWSQLGMRAVSGPLVGTPLKSLPVRVVSFSEFRLAHPEAMIVSRETGHQRDYEQSPYESYLKEDRLVVPVSGAGKALPRKALGVGVSATKEDETLAWFVPQDAIDDLFTLRTPAGEVVISSGPAGVRVVSAPQDAGIRTAQTFYFSWSAFYPQTKVVTTQDAVGDAVPQESLVGPGSEG